MVRCGQCTREGMSGDGQGRAALSGGLPGRAALYATRLGVYSTTASPSMTRMVWITWARQIGRRPSRTHGEGTR